MRPRLLLLGFLAAMMWLLGLFPFLPRRDATLSGAVPAGDALPAGAVARVGSVRLRHAGAVFAVAYAPQGKVLASAGGDGAVRLWDAATGQEIRCLHWTEDAVTGVAFSPNGNTLAAVSRDGRLAVWDAASGQELDRWHAHARFYGEPNGQAATSLAFSADGRLLATGRETVLIWEAATGRKRAEVPGRWEGIRALAFTPDGSALVIASATGLRACDPTTGKEIDGDAKRKPRPPQETEVGDKGRTPFFGPGSYWSVAFSPDGKTVASGDEGRLPGRVQGR